MQKSEQGIIGAFLIDADFSMKAVCHILKPEHFLCELYSEIYREILNLYTNGEEVNVITLSTALENEKFDRNYYIQELKECADACETSALAKSYAIDITRDYKSRTVKELVKNMNLDPKNIDDAIGTMLTRIEALQTDDKSTSRGLREIVSDYQGNYFNDNKKEVIKTGFYHLDEAVSLEKGDVCVIAGRPATGKSSFVNQIMLNVASRGKKVGYFNLEMGESQVYERMLAKTTQMSLVRIRKAKNFLGNEKELFDKGNEKLSEYNIVISTGSKSVSEIKSESRYQKFDLIVIDYLQLVRSDKSYANRASEVGNISKSIKALAMELDVPVLLLSQLNRASEQTTTKEPTMSELRESGDIEQDASIIVLLWNVAQDDKKNKGLKVDKNRQGETIKEGLTFDGERMTFDEYCGDFKRFLANIRANDKATESLEEYEKGEITNEAPEWM